ncbi:MAG: hypothetical protein ACYSWQ_16180 [Planctomycetota bacterium]
MSLELRIVKRQNMGARRWAIYSMRLSVYSASSSRIFDLLRSLIEFVPAVLHCFESVRKLDRVYPMAELYVE